MENVKKTYRRGYYIDNTLLTQLEDLVNLSCKNTDFVNDSIEELIKTTISKINDRADGELSIKYTVLIRESNLKG